MSDHGTAHARPGRANYAALNDRPVRLSMAETGLLRDWLHRLAT